MVRDLLKTLDMMAVDVCRSVWLSTKPKPYHQAMRVSLPSRICAPSIFFQCVPPFLRTLPPSPSPSRSSQTSVHWVRPSCAHVPGSTPAPVLQLTSAHFSLSPCPSTYVSTA